MLQLQASPARFIAFPRSSHRLLFAHNGSLSASDNTSGSKLEEPA